jgi:urease accessory protein
MRRDEPIAATGWEAELSLEFERRGARTVLASRRHSGPLVVQKSLHPEGPEVCHGIVLHPPGGICGGDRLALRAHVGRGAHALLTTPGAGKWYRSAGPEAAQTLWFDLDEGAALEWLPQESIVFDGAIARMSASVRLNAGSRYLGWDLVCLGRRASGERFDAGSLRIDSRIERNGAPLWIERGLLGGGSAALAAAPVLAGRSTFGSLIAAGADIDAQTLQALRGLDAESGLWGITRLPAMTVARWLGDTAEHGRRYFVKLWQVLRPVLLGREPAMPRIWAT